MPAEQVLRAMLIKQMKPTKAPRAQLGARRCAPKACHGFSYEELAFHLADSNVYRWFCRLGIGDKPPKKSTAAAPAGVRKVTEKTQSQAERVAEQLDKLELANFMQALEAQALAAELREYIGMAGQVISQTERRVLRGESVPAADKILSIFEPHTDIIVKDNREPIYGHKVCLTAGASGMVTDVVVEKGTRRT